MTEALNFNLDPESLTLGEMEELEDHCGMSAAEVGEVIESGKAPAKLLTVMAWLALRRQNPDATIEDAKALPLKVLIGASAPKAEDAPVSTA